MSDATCSRKSISLGDLTEPVFFVYVLRANSNIIVNGFDFQG